MVVWVAGSQLRPTDHLAMTILSAGGLEAGDPRGRRVEVGDVGGTQIVRGGVGLRMRRRVRRARAVGYI